MRDPERDAGRLRHIVTYANNVEEMIDGITYEDFANDKIRYFDFRALEGQKHIAQGSALGCYVMYSHAL